MRPWEVRPVSLQTQNRLSPSFSSSFVALNYDREVYEQNCRILGREYIECQVSSSTKSKAMPFERACNTLAVRFYEGVLKSVSIYRDRCLDRFKKFCKVGKYPNGIEICGRFVTQVMGEAL